MRTALAILACLACVLTLAAGPTAAAAKDKGGFVSAPPAAGGFSGPGLAPTTVREAATMRDDARVTLRGNIVQHLGKDKYLFRDETGTIRVEIDSHKWQGLTITPDDRVEIQGEVDKDWNSVEVDVDRIAKMR